MRDLIGTTPSSLSRAKNGRTASLRAAKHIAVVAAFTIELGHYIEQSQREALPARTDPANMQRWLLSGRIMVGGVPRIPFEVLSDFDLAAAALTEVRLERHQVASRDEPDL